MTAGPPPSPVTDGYDAAAGHAAAAVEAALRELARAREAPEVGPLQVALEELRAALAPTRQGPPVVAVVGRTKAGKSTLRYVLTGEGEDGIGRGGQRTTRTVIEYRWQGMSLRDTPGVGARAGAADTAVAVEAAATADLVLWVATSEGLQQQTIEPVRGMLGRGVPVLVVVNHKDAHELVDGRGWDPDVLRTDRDARDRRIRAVLDGTVGAPDGVVHVQLDVARWARADERRGPAWAASGLPCLQRSLESAAAQGQAARAATRRAHQVAALIGVGTELQALHAGVDEALEVQHAAVAQAGAARAAGRADWQRDLDAGRARALDLVSAQLDAAVRLTQAREHRGEAATAWRQAVQTLDQEVAALVQEAARAGLQAQRSTGGEPLLLQADAIEMPPVDLAGDPLTARGTRASFNVLKVVIGVAPFFFLGPLGAPVTAVVAPLVTEALAGDLGPQLEQEQHKRAASLAGARAAAERALHVRVDALLAAADTAYLARVERPAWAEAVRLTARLRQLERQHAEVDRARTAVEEALHDQ